MRNSQGQFIKGSSGFSGHHSTETKIKLRNAFLGIKPIGAGWNKGLPAWNRGLHPSVQTIQKIKAARSRQDFKGAKSPTWKGGPPTCTDCGKPDKTYSYRTRCRACHYKHNRGPNHYKWTGGPKNNLIKIRSSAEYKHWRLNVYRRDWFTCQMPGCGYKGQDIEAHHIQPVREDPTLILDVKNGITLCEPCHMLTRNNETFYANLFAAIVSIRVSLQTQ